MTEERQSKEIQSSYRSIFKATSLFGGVQVYTILIQVLKSKIIAILLGPLGVGIQGLYQSALDLIKQATSFGLSQSAVRDVAEASGSDDTKKISRTVSVLHKVVWFTGLLGLFCVFILSPLLSKASFGNSEYVIPFICLSVILLFDQLSAGQKVILQGTRRLKDLAKATSIGITISLIFSLPCYFCYGVNGIVPAMILTASVTLIVSWYYSRRVDVNKSAVSLKDIFSEGKSMIIMGLSMSISGVMAMGAAYLIRNYIRSIGGIIEVGLFQAGFVIINSYVGLVFNAISTDYYPRLASVNKDNIKCREVVCQQGEISVFLMAPLLSICILTMPFVIKTLYSSEFLPADNYIKWACIGMMFRLASWIVSYLFIAKAESKLFIINEFVASVNYLWLSILGYKIGGLTGIGVAFALNYILYFIQVYLISYYRYGFRFLYGFVFSFNLHLFLVIICLLSMMLLDFPYNYLLGSFVTLLSIILAIKGLNQRVDVLSIINTIRHK